MNSDHVLTDVVNGVATLTLNRPDEANALSEAMIEALSAKLGIADQDSAVRVIVIAAKGKIFCAGHNLREMRQHEDNAYFETLFARCSAMMLSVRNMQKPVIAKVQGAAVAAGCQLVASCDLAYASENAKFGVNGINLGLFCSTPSVAVSRAMQPRQALELLLTGDLITASRAAELGLINAALPSDMLNDKVSKTALAIASKQPSAITLGKRVFWSQLHADEASAYAMAGNCMAENIGFEVTKTLIDGFLAKAKH